MEELTTARRILFGVGWGVLRGGAIAAIVFPITTGSIQIGFILAIVILTAIGLGLSLYWNAAQGPCPNCETVLISTPSGATCRNCGQKVSAEDRQIIAVESKQR
jgi:hypothetical protein